MNSISTGLPSAAVSSRLTPPKLNDAARYARVERVPIIDTLERTYLKTTKDGNQVRIYESVDKAQLKKIFENSKRAEENGDYGLIFVGHTDDSGKETDQPPKVGYIANHQLGEHNGRPTILADVYIDKEKCRRFGKKYFDSSFTVDDLLDEFPRRSAEVVALSKPVGYIDSVALLKRTPERQLGTIASQFKIKSESVYRFECPACKKEKMSLQSSMMEHQARQDKVKSKRDVFKSSLKLVEQLGNHLFDEEANGEPEDSSESTSSELFNEPSDEPSEPMLGEEPSMSSTAKSKMSKAGPSEPNYEEYPSSTSSSSSSEASEPSEASGDPSHPGTKNHRKEHREPSRMDPSEPSKKKSKLNAGSAASTPGPTTSIPKLEKSKMSSHKDKSRMKDDDERISSSRFARQLEESRKLNSQLAARLDQIDAEKREAINERKLVQLQAEGYELDRAEELARFKRLNLTEEQVDEEISRFRKIVRPSPVGQSLIPSFSPDYGGASVPRQKSVMELMQPLPEENDPRNTAVIAPIIGSHIARMHMESDEGKSMVRPNPISRSVDMESITRFIKQKVS